MKHTSLINSSSLKISQLNYKLGGNKRIKDISLEIASGKKIVLLGLNGAGKSTLIRLLLGELSISSGLVEYTEGQKNIQPQDLAFKKYLGYQADTMLAIAELDGVSYLKLCGSFKQIEPAKLARQIAQIARQWKIEDILDKPMTALSKGNLQKLSIAQAFLGEPKWLFFDEPCQSLDPVEQLRFNQNITSLEHFESCIVSTHNVDHALEIADEIVLIHQGVLAHHFSLDEQSKMLVVIKEMPVEQTREFETSLSQLRLEFDSRFERIYSLQPHDEKTRLALQGLAVEWSKYIEFFLPEKEALMPLFRLLASGELDLTAKIREQIQGGCD